MIRTGIYLASVPALLGVVFAHLEWWIAAGAAWGLAGFVLFFFRDPNRVIPSVPGAIVAPADGKVLSVEQVPYDGELRTKVTIFLSLFDVHVNRAPIAGVIKEVQYLPGRFHVASRSVAGRENEQNTVAMEGQGTRVVFKQIAGLLARRIEFWKTPGDRLVRGERLGMIRFGSRAEVFFDPQARLEVRPGDRVRGGTSILAIQE